MAIVLTQGPSGLLSFNECDGLDQPDLAQEEHIDTNSRIP